MAATIYYDKDADLNALKGKTVAIIGYGSQGHAQAQNLRDSGVNVVIGQRPGGKNYDLAISHGFKPVSAADAAKQADVINILVPDELQGDLYEKEIKPNLKPGAILMCSHGFNIHFGFIKPPAGHDALLVAPKGPGHLVRSEFVAGGGVPCLIATSEGASDDYLQDRPRLRQSHRRHPRRRHPNDDQGRNRNRPLRRTSRPLRRRSALVKAGFETLVEAGYQPEMAYFECMHELKLIVDLFYQGGLNYMRYSVSNTAEYGDYTRGPRIITAETKKEMKKILTEIQEGKFAKEWIAEAKSGGKNFKAMKEKDKTHPVEVTGAKLRKLMSWINAKEVD